MKTLRSIKLFLMFVFFNTTSFGQEKPVLVVSKGHHQAINCMDISPDGKTIVSGANDNLVKVYDLIVKQEMNTFSGHDRQVDLVQFSPDGKYIISTSAQQLLIHSHPEGKLLREFPIKNLIGDYNFQVTKDNILYLGYPTGILVYDIVKGELIKKLPIKSRNFVFLPDEQTIVTNAIGENREVGIGFYSTVNYELTDFFSVKGLVLNNYKIAENGKKIAFAISTSEIGIFNIKTKTVESRVSVAPTIIQTFKLTPDATQLVTTGYDGHVIFRDVANGKVLRDIKDISPDGSPYSMAMGLSAIDFTDKGKTIAFAYTDLRDSKANYTVEWFEFKDLKSINRHSGDVKISLSIGIDHSGTILSTGTVGSSMGVKCLDLTKASQKAFIPGTAYLGTGGKYLAAVNNPMVGNIQPKLEIYSMPSVSLYRTFDLFGFAQIELSPSGKYVTALDQDYKPNSDPSKVQVTPYIRIWDVETGEEIVHIERTLQTLPRDIIFSLDEKEVYISYPHSIETIDLASKKVVHSTPIKVGLDYNNSISPDGKKIVAFTGFSVVGIDVVTGISSELLELDDLNIPFAISFSADHSLIGVSILKANKSDPYRVLVYDWETKSLVCELIGHNDIIRQIAFDNQNKNAYSVDDNGVILMWDLLECKPRGSFLALGEEDYIIQSPEGYYKASKGNIASIGFRQNGSLYTFDQFDLRYNRPDKVLKSLGLAQEEQIAMYHKAYKKRLRRMGFTIDNFSKDIHAPKIEIVDSKEIPLKTKDDFIAINILASDESIPLDRLNISVNGVPIYGRLGKDLKEKKILDYSSEIKIPLTLNDNQIQMSVMNTDGTESLRQSFSINCEKPLRKPNLYVVAVGVKSYQDSSMNLTYSDKDAEDFTQLFNQENNSVFNKVHIDLLTNDNVTKESVAKTRAILENSTIDDQVILYYSGHGLLDDEYDYFLSTYDVNFSSPSERGLSFDKFKDLVDGIPARKRLVLVDACHSGEIDKDEVAYVPREEVEDNTLVTKAFKEKGFLTIGLENSFELMKELFVELRKESGATIIASSAGKEYSLEGDEWNNGVFTFALKEGLIGLKADLNKDKNISVSELKSYLFIRVDELTNGKQTPTVRRENLQHNSVIY